MTDIIFIIINDLQWLKYVVTSFKKVKHLTFKGTEFLTIGFTLGAALRDVGAEHGAHSRVRCEAPGEFLAIWIPTEVFPQVPAQQGKSSHNLL